MPSQKPFCAHNHPIGLEKLILEKTDIHIESCITCYSYEQSIPDRNIGHIIILNDNRLKSFEEQIKQNLPYSLLPINLLSLSSDNQQEEINKYLLSIQNPITQKILNSSLHKNSLYIIYLIKKISCVHNFNILLKKGEFVIIPQKTLPQLIQNKSLLTINCHHRKNLESKMSTLPITLELIPCITCYVNKYEKPHSHNLQMHLNYLNFQIQEIYKYLKLQEDRKMSFFTLFSSIRNTHPDILFEEITMKTGRFYPIAQYYNSQTINTIIHLLYLHKLYLNVDDKVIKLRIYS
ncbi:hypothetical protein AB837_00439 [bacterium AB1]|nr:hypothetical protein AB837_00439 [bacterium AB1]